MLDHAGCLPFAQLESPVWLSGTIPPTGQVELWPKDEHGFVAGFDCPGVHNTNASTLDALIVQVSETQDSKHFFNLQLQWRDRATEREFRPISGDDSFDSTFTTYPVGSRSWLGSSFVSFGSIAIMLAFLFPRCI
jgi:hypothetical protein